MLSRIKTIVPIGHRAASTTSKVSEASKQSAHPPPSSPPSKYSDIAPPKRKYRDEVSVLRALSKCVNPHLGLPTYGCALEPWLGAGGTRERSIRMAKAAGRNAARHIARNMLANDLTALVTEVPRIDSLVPLQTGESIRKELADGTFNEQEAMERLLLLLAPKDAWALYKDATGVKWDSVILHRLLDLQCATNGGNGGPDFFENLPFVDRGSLPEPEELYYAAENRVLSALRNVVETPSEKIPTSTSVVAPTSTTSLEDVDSPTVEMDNLEELQATEAQLEKVELEGGESVLEEILSAEPSSWHKGCPAEQLFSQHPEVLRTPAAYTAMIRGAARFGAADRAWELAKEALSSVKLPLCVYNDLLRCAHECSGKEGTWTRLKEGFELLKTSKLRPDALTFSSALFSLYKSNQKTASTGQNVADKALGLLQEAKRLGIQPTLGLHANLLRAIISSRVSKSGVTYRITEVLADVLADVEKNWDTLSRADVFSSVDDYEFASTAMFCATADTSSTSSICLVQRVYDLVHKRCGDRRFLFRNSVDSRGFYARYLVTLMLNGVGEVSELTQLYHNHRQIFHANQRAYEVLYHRLKTAISRWTEALEKVNTPQGKFNGAMLENLEEEASKAFETLGEMIFDFVAISTRLPRRLPSYISNSLMPFTFVDPWIEIRTPLLPSRSSLRSITETGCHSAHKAAVAFSELIRSHEARLPITQSLSSLTKAEVTALVRMALHPLAFNTGGPNNQQTVSQKEANERALNCASDLLMLNKDAMTRERPRTSDVGAMEMLRACWFTSSRSVTERVWSLLEYFAGLKYISGQCAQHVFVEGGHFWKVLDAAEASLVPEGKTRAEVGSSANSSRIQIITAVRRKFKEHVALNVPEE